MRIAPVGLAWSDDPFRFGCEVAALTHGHPTGWLASGCLAQIIPEAVSGDLCGTSFPNSIGGIDRARGRPFVYVEVPAGGNGGFREADGSSAFVNVDFGNIRSIHNAEHLENEMPLLVERSVLRTDSGGPGASRGGLGMRREVRLLDGDAAYSVLSDRAVIPPFGILGGAGAAPVRVAVARDGAEQELATPGRATGQPIRGGDIVVMESAGGGGYGDPLTRPPPRVAVDVAAGYVSVDRARADYGVVAKADGTVDEAATDDLRRGQSLPTLSVEADDSPSYDGIRGRQRRLRVTSELAAALGVEEGDLVELLGRHPAPLRAWVRIDDTAPRAALTLDEFARRVLGVDAGGTVRLRRLATIIRPGFGR